MTTGNKMDEGSLKVIFNPKCYTFDENNRLSGGKWKPASKKYTPIISL